MTTMKKLVSLLLAAMMLLAVMNVAVASEFAGTITIENAVAGHKYSAYCIFDLDYNVTTQAYLYTITENSDWYNFVINSGYFTLTEDGTDESNNKKYVVAWNEEKDESEAANFAALALAYAKENNVSADVESTASEDGECNIGVQWLGYYLVDSSMGALCALDTTATSVIISEKNEIPTITKEVKEGDAWGETNTAEIGQEVEFRAIISVVPGAENYVMHDDIDEAAFDTATLKVTKVEVFDENGNSLGTLVLGTDYQTALWSNDGASEPHYCDYTKTCELEVTIENAVFDNFAAADTIHVYYSAVLKPQAGIGVPEEGYIDDLNLNDVALEYGDDHFTEWDQTKTYTFELDINKYTMVGEGDTATSQPLADAKFKLYRDEELSNVVEVIPVEDATTLGTNVHMVYNEQNMGVYDYTGGIFEEVTSDENGAIEIIGLDAGTYYLVETEAPAGYTKLADPIRVTINEDGTVSMNGGDAADEIGVLNQTGATLPSTGGIGTTIFYAVGGVLVLLAVVLLVTKRRVGEEN